MIHNVLDVQAVVFEIDEGNKTQVVPTYINDPPFVLMSKVVQCWKHFSQVIRALKGAVT